jgi:hypothetical protein
MRWDKRGLSSSYSKKKIAREEKKLASKRMELRREQ